MARVKSLSKEKLIQLLEAVETDEVIKPDDIYENDLLPFLEFYNIKAGKEIIRTELLYNLYCHWSRNPMDKHNFYHKIPLYLPISDLKITPKRSCYSINKKLAEITREIALFVYNKKTNKIKSKHWKTHYDNFLKYYGIEEGNTWIESYILYRLYDKWTYITGVKQVLGYKQFFNFCKLYFEHKRKTEDRVTWFAVNDVIKKHLTEESMENIRRKYDKKEK